MLRYLLWVTIITVTLKENVKSEEGMWLPHMLDAIRGDMYAKGLKIDVSEIYHPDKPSIIHAVVSFGGYCTGEIISPYGLLITNHHCGYRPIQQLSSPENDLLKNGFWAYNRSEEIPCPGLEVTIIVRIEEVTERILPVVDSVKDPARREQYLHMIYKKIGEEYTYNTHYQYVIKPFYEGKQYILFLTETFKDVRLVGTPPEFIGKFGGDTDNWMWPRHTGDFSLFRIYADSNNRPASYSPHNIPYTPRYFLPISLKELREKDFTMVIGFPGRTQEYLTARRIQFIQEQLNPMRIHLREGYLNIMKHYMDKDRKTGIQYAAKYAGKSNYYKKWQGELFGLNKMNVIEKKQQFEQEYRIQVKNHSPYDTIIDFLSNAYHKLEKEELALQFYQEVLFNGFEILRPALLLMKETHDNSVGSYKERYASLLSFYKDYYAPLDKALCMKSVEYIHQYLPEEYKPSLLAGEVRHSRIWIEKMYKKSIFADTMRLKHCLFSLSHKKAKAKIKKDPVYLLAKEVQMLYENKILPSYLKLTEQLTSAQQIYMEGIMQYMQHYKKIYPDANGTLRLSYGIIEPSQPYDGIIHHWYTTHQGILEKYNSQSAEFYLDSTFLALLHRKDFEPYADSDGNLRVCFIASNHTTGGNSGSPVLNSEGQWIGINFDRSWESTMSDLYYDSRLCRNIAVTAHYVLFVIDKYAHAHHLIEEMKIVKTTSP